MDLLPWLALIRLSVYYQEGAEKYGADNWRKGIPDAVLLDSGMRHGGKVVAGLTDEKHLEAALWNLLNLLEFRERKRLGLSPGGTDNINP
jgi:hypothetical protein